MFIAFQDAAPAADAGGSPLVSIALAVVGYVFYSLCWSIIARKAGHADKAFWAWIPVLNFILPLKVANKSLLWLVLLLVPVVNIVAWLLICVGTAKARNRGVLSGALAAFVPVIGLPLLAVGE
jgi:hypothetical protein